MGLPGDEERAAAVRAAQQPHPSVPPLEEGEVLTRLSFEWEVAPSLSIGRDGGLVTLSLAATAVTKRFERGFVHGRHWHLLRVGDELRWIVDSTTVEVP